MLKATSDFKTLKSVLNVTTNILCCSNRNNFNTVHRSLCSNSFLGYNACGGLFNNNGETRYSYLSNVNQNKCNLFRTQCRNLSVPSSIDSVIQSYAQLFKWLSESTVVEYAQNTIILIHDQTGLPWWASIMLTTVLMRSLVTLPLSLYQVRNSGVVNIFTLSV